MPQLFTIHSPIQLLLIMIAVIFFFKAIFKLENWYDSQPAKTIKKEEKKESKPSKSTTQPESSAKTPVVEKKEEIKETKSETIVCPYASSQNENSNYLYERFVENPTRDDIYVNKKIHSAFISEDDLSNIRERQPKVFVKNRNELHKKIEEITINNKEIKERLLKEFEDLPKDIKLILIDKIMENL